jgi:hypothetical protein
VSSVTKPDLGTALLLRRRTNQIDIFPKVRVFLDSIARNSIKSKTTYSSGLSLLQNFLNIDGGEQRHKFHGYNCENILEPLLENRINVYELLDSFVSHVLATKPEIAPRSLRLYIAALRSYFAYYDIDIIPSKFRRKVKMPKFYREDNPDKPILQKSCLSELHQSTITLCNLYDALPAVLAARPDFVNGGYGFGKNEYHGFNIGSNQIK